ncbi:alkene reductase [Falsiroseomonas bella]|uniref:Alkene reductase n=1 Tax=Falsiroseomonas bella TaxID=2184016 RepID=A0A317F7H6_9PROT|nr:alkene reductase [Falsiroseomonas bella]PWS34353.1 alkene reductase [Falsiroseomonas bella]
MPTQAGLFTPLRLGALDLPHRVVMAPMTRNRSPGNLANALNATYYAQRAAAALIITEGTAPDAMGRGYIDIPGLYDAAQVAAWRQVTDAVHARGGLIAVQLMHVGRISHPDFLEGATPVAPSAVAAAGAIHTWTGPKPHPVPRALDAAEIPGVIATYARAARLAREAGFDAVEIHGANGYLPNQFLAPNANLRRDAWGGSVEKRARFLLAATDAAIAEIGAGRVGVRLSPGSGFNDIADPEAEATYAHVISALDRRELAWLHVVDARPGFDVPALVAQHYRGAVMLNGGYDGARAEADIAAGRAALVSFGTPFISNPDLPVRLRSGAPLAAADRGTFYGGDARGYVDYPLLDPVLAA